MAKKCKLNTFTSFQCALGKINNYETISIQNYQGLMDSWLPGATLLHQTVLLPVRKCLLIADEINKRKQKEFPGYCFFCLPWQMTWMICLMK